MNNYNYKRRQFLQHSALAIATAALPGFARAGGQIKNAPTAGFKPDVELEITARKAFIPILPGANTAVFKYYGKVLKGPKTALQAIPGYLGPVLNLVQGQKVRVFFYNQLPEPSIVHWHGLHVPQKMDGHPMYTIQPDEIYVYEFEVKNPAGTSFYHTHAHELTAEQVYRGLAGLIKVGDEQERKLGLPDGEYDIPIAIQDRRFTADNQLQYVHGMHEKMLGFLGDAILVNGQPNSVIPVKTRAYRLRVLNGSNSRIYKLGWEDGTPLTAIGTDAGLLEKPETLPYIMLAPGERVELWADFSGREAGSDLVLRSLEFHGAMPPMAENMRSRHDENSGGMGMMGGMRRGMGMMGGGMGGTMTGGLAQGESFPIVKFHIAEKLSESPALPETLVDMRRLTASDAANPDKPLPIAITELPMQPLLNGKTFEMEQYMDFEKVPVGSIQKIRIYHDHGSAAGGGMQDHDGSASDHGGMGMMGGGMMGMMLMMAHPIHLHGQQYQILSRTQTEPSSPGYDTVKDGFIKHGWKDTVLVMPGEEIQILKPFEDYTGLFLYHCHNLEHEDLGMMRNFYVA
jgi:FtsP/CotA-like multicopper oxidase with cupredoxin domain